MHPHNAVINRYIHSNCGNLFFKCDWKRIACAPSVVDFNNFYRDQIAAVSNQADFYNPSGRHDGDQQFQMERMFTRSTQAIRACIRKLGPPLNIPLLRYYFQSINLWVFNLTSAWNCKTSSQELRCTLIVNPQVTTNYHEFCSVKCGNKNRQSLRVQQSENCNLKIDQKHLNPSS